ncbi:putative reverse transcriptase-rnase h-integrase [Lyophyllum shimeji]|uniref:Reverse transcriptase-rnase h-integrase n=1 Tax=Lyophyllum shimeji TaxID=47721 RepID=A0A9P3PHP5_LYOSH|nr:putative reverse transcriptase-rnase h-integrase [Lyophyllum shimeji]
MAPTGTVTTTTAAKPAELKIRTPNDFDGDRSKLNQWLQNIRLYLEMNSDVYNTDRKKITFALSFMNGGTAGPWKETMLDELFALDEWGTWKDFVQEIKDAFSAADAAGDARAKLKVLKQTGTADEYIAEFKVLAAASQIKEDNSLIEYFMDGLQPKLVEKVLGVEKPPTTIKGWYDYASRFDNQWRRARAIINRHRQDNKKPSTSSRSYTPPRYVPTRDPNAMDVDRLSLEEREEHFKKGLCFECHKPGHRAADHKKGTVPEQKKYDFTSRKEAPRTGKETHLRIKAMIEALDEKEKEECMKKLEDEGF